MKRNRFYIILQGPAHRRNMALLMGKPIDRNAQNSSSRPRKIDTRPENRHIGAF